MERHVSVFLIGVAVAMATPPPPSCAFLHIYKELNCTAMPPAETWSNSSAACPQWFQCADFHPQPDRCYYRGVAYEMDSALPEDAGQGACSINCRCSGLRGGATFECAQVDCVEQMYPPEPEENCILTTTLEDCCSDDKVCGDEEIAKLPTCEVDGRTYRGGQVFTPRGSCRRCVCNENYNGTIHGVDFCEDIVCDVEIYYQAELARRCAPVLLSGYDTCCPIQWECPNNSTKITPASRPSEVEATCKFGDATLRIGDAVEVQSKCVTCSCRVPPLVTCMLDPDC